MNTPDTIAALATPPGTGGIAVLRISGPLSAPILHALFRRKDGRRQWKSHEMVYGSIVFQNEILDEAMAVLMAAPRSYTREDVAELHCHGGALTTGRVLDAIIAQGARPALPGEFTRRAFEAGRIDLAQAEAIARLIGASGEAAARAALRDLRGGLSRYVSAAQRRLIDMLAALEAALDFPDEVDETLTSAQIRAEAATLRDELLHACGARKGRVLEQGLDVVIAGPPNAGKSSLLNALLEEERAIVTDTPGTTRDVVTGSLMLQGLRVTLSDTAGLRTTADPAEVLGVARARERMEQADLILAVLDGAEPLNAGDADLLRALPSDRAVAIVNKSDLGLCLTPDAIQEIHPGLPCITLSVLHGQGLDAVRALLASHAANAQEDSALLTSARHIQAATKAAAALADALLALDTSLPMDLALIDLRQALHDLGEITGETADEKIIDAIFERFCVGK